MDSEPQPHLPIAQLNPSVDSSASIRGIVTLVWPYSSSRKTTSILLVEPDFRLRQKKGQVRVTFNGSSALAVARSGLTSGDELRIYLDGATWLENSLSAGTPGRAVDWELRFGRRLWLEKNNADEGQDIINISRTSPSPEPDLTSSPPRTPVTVVLPEPRTQVRGLNETGVWASPAFLKRISLPSITAYTEVDLETEASWLDGRPSKRTKFGRASGEWRFADRTPSPSKGVDIQDFANDDEFGQADGRIHVVPSEKDTSGVSHVGNITRYKASNAQEPEPLISISSSKINEKQFQLPADNEYASPNPTLAEVLADNEAERLPVQASESVGVPREHVYHNVTGQVDLTTPGAFESQRIVTDPSIQTRLGSESRILISGHSDTPAHDPLGSANLKRFLDNDRVIEDSSLNDYSSYSSEESILLSRKNVAHVSSAKVLFPDDGVKSNKISSNDEHYLEEEKHVAGENSMAASEEEFEESEGLSTNTDNEDEVYDIAAAEKAIEPGEYGLATGHSKSIEVIELSSSEDDRDGSEPPNSTDAANDSDEELNEQLVKQRFSREGEDEDSNLQKMEHIQEQKQDHYTRQRYQGHSSEDGMAEEDIEPQSKSLPVFRSPSTAAVVLSGQVPQPLTGSNASTPVSEAITGNASFQLTGSETDARIPSSTEAGPLLVGIAGKGAEVKLLEETTAADTVERALPLTPQLSGLQEPTSPSDSHNIKIQELPPLHSSNQTTTNQQLFTPISTQLVAPEVIETNLPAKAENISLTYDSVKDVELIQGLHSSSQGSDTRWSAMKLNNIQPESTEENSLDQARRVEPLDVRSDNHKNDDAMQPVTQSHLSTTIDPTENKVKHSLDSQAIRHLNEPESRYANLQSPSEKWISKETILKSFDGTSEESVRSDIEVTKIIETNGFRTALSYFTSLASLGEYFGSTIDVIAVVLSSTKPARAKKGPRHMLQTLHLLDRSTSARPSSSTAAQLYRPSQAALPRIQSGDVILLRDFKVQSQKRKMILVSTDSSGWAVFHQHEPVQMRGPPVEIGVEEEDFAQDLLDWWANREEGTRTRAASKMKLNEEPVTQQTMAGVLNNKHTLRDGKTYTGEQSRDDHTLRDGTAYRDE